MITGSVGGGTRELSLVEQKRLQWQKEREEMERMGTEMFSHSQTQTKFEKTSIKTYFSNVDLSMNSSSYSDPSRYQNLPPRTENPNYYNSYGPPTAGGGGATRAMRSPSLPPIAREKFYNYPPSQTLIINPMDTGYHSETSPADCPVEVWTNDDDGHGSNKTVTIRRPKFFDNGNRTMRPEVDNRRNPQQFPDGSTQMPQMNPDVKPLGTPNSLSSGQTFSTIPSGEFRGANPRRKWSDNEVHTPQSSYFDPMSRSLDSRSSQNVPYWLEKGLNEIRDSEDESVRSHIRGQNIPLDPNVLAERAGRRRKGIELQNAIKEQLLERERIKKWEKEKRIQEELLMEEKLRQQLEAERERLEYERKVQEEKMENERRKAEIMRLAVEKAELEAKLEKEKRRMQQKPATETAAPAATVTEPAAVKVVRAEERSQNIPKTPNEETSILTVSEKPIVEFPTQSPSPAVHHPKEVVVSKPTDIDGIALVLQSISPMVPLANIGQDLFGLNNSVNNLQFALLLAQQQQQLNIQARQLNTISSASSILSTATSEDTSLNTVRDASITNQLKSDEEKKVQDQPKSEIEKDLKECIYCCRIHGQHNRGKENVQEKDAEVHVEEKKTEEKPQIVVDEELVKAPVEQIPEEQHKLPSDGTFIKEDSDQMIALDAEIATQTDSETFGNEIVTWHKPRILTPRKYRVSSSLRETTEMGIQTDLFLLQNCNICTHKQLVLKEISQVTTSVTQTSSRRLAAELSPIRRGLTNPDGVKDGTLTTTTVTTTTTIRAKANERRHGKKEPRPKWGVNQPASQYVKASDRDPFCLRRRKKHQLKNYSLTDHEEENYSKKIDSGISSNISSHSLDLEEGSPVEEDLVCEESTLAVEPSSRRNMCTEITPITTDGNGNVFVNFQEARRVVLKDELEMKRAAQSNALRERIMEKRSDDLPFIPGVFRTERKLTKSMSDFFPTDVTKVEKNEINMSKRSEMESE